MSAKYAFTQGLREVRFLFCQTAEHSAGVRLVGPDLTSLGGWLGVVGRGWRRLFFFSGEGAGNAGQTQPTTRAQKQRANQHLLPTARSFLNRAYPSMKKNNPNTPILIREAAGTMPKVYARYDLGVEKSQSLAGLSDKQIEDAVSSLVKQA